MVKEVMWWSLYFDHSNVIIQADADIAIGCLHGKSPLVFPVGPQPNMAAAKGESVNKKRPHP